MLIAMSAIELTPSQRMTLSALINLYKQSGCLGAVKGEAIAEEVSRKPGTIRNQMQSLKALQLVDGIPGPKGGYKPTAKAYRTMDIPHIDDTRVPIKCNGEALDGSTVTEVSLISVHDPERCRAEVRLDGSTQSVSDGETIKVGPTPVSELEITGVMIGREASKNSLIIRIEEMIAPG
jgi:predicted transcriptional regulator